MGRRLIECVPNFSEGRDLAKVDAIVAAISSTPGVALLGRESDRDHNRSVVTFAGPPEPVAAAALRGIAKAAELIDLTAHDGVHPRVGAADVVPFVPIANVTLAECAEIAHQVGRECWRTLGIPVYFYEAAALAPERARLENIRRGGFAWLREHVAERPPDVGGPALHPTAGATVIGARSLLIAFNINLTTTDAGVARAIAAKVRESSGGLPSVKAIGVYLESRGMAQVSLNLTDFERVGMREAFDAVRIEAARHGIGIATTEIIGLAPRRALIQAAAGFLECENFTPARVLEDRIDELAPVRPFDDVLEDLSNPSSPAGGGSASALAGAMAAALGHMVARLSQLEAGHFLEHRVFFAEAAGRDAEAFQRTRESHGSDESIRGAAIVPAEITERARALDRDLLALSESAPSRLRSDVITALALARAARAGGIATARANLSQIQDERFRGELEERLNRRA